MWVVTNEKKSHSQGANPDMPEDTKLHMSTTQNRKISSYKEKITFWIGVITFLVLLLGFAYAAGRWTAGRENKEEIILLNPLAELI